MTSRHRLVQRRKAPVDRRCPECGSGHFHLFLEQDPGKVIIRCQDCNKDRVLAAGEEMEFECANPECGKIHVVNGAGEVFEIVEEGE